MRFDVLPEEEEENEEMAMVEREEENESLGEEMGKFDLKRFSLDEGEEDDEEE